MIHRPRRTRTSPAPRAVVVGSLALLALSVMSLQPAAFVPQATPAANPEPRTPNLNPEPGTPNPEP